MRAKEKIFDIRLIKSLKVGALYSENDLEKLFGISFEEGLEKEINKYICFRKSYRKSGECMRKYMGRADVLDPQQLNSDKDKERKAAKKSMSRWKAPKLVLYQTYSVRDLEQLCNLRESNGLFEVLAPYAKFEKLPNGHYKPIALYEARQEPVEVGYNKLALRVINYLRSKFGSQEFRMHATLIPYEYRQEMPPGLIPRIWEYLLENSLLEKTKRNHYRFLV